MSGIINDLLSNFLFVLERLNWLSVVDLLLVTLIIFSILRLLRDTQAVVLLRGVLLLIALISLLTSLEVLPAFSWLVRTTLPALLLAIPVIFAPEIRRALERLGRAGGILSSQTESPRGVTSVQLMIRAIVEACARLADRRHGALIVMQRFDSLNEYVRTGVPLEAHLTPELLLQIFYPNTPLHDGAAIVSGSRVLAAACVMPLSASGVLSHSPERQMGLRHRAALGISEVSDAVAVVVSEETGTISLMYGGRMIRRLDRHRLENVLHTLFIPFERRRGFLGILERLTSRSRDQEEEQL